MRKNTGVQLTFVCAGQLTCAQRNADDEHLNQDNLSKYLIAFNLQSNNSQQSAWACVRLTLMWFKHLKLKHSCFRGCNKPAAVTGLPSFHLFEVVLIIYWLSWFGCWFYLLLKKLETFSKTIQMVWQRETLKVKASVWGCQTCFSCLWCVKLSCSCATASHSVLTTLCASLRRRAVADGGRVCDRCRRLPAAVQRLVWRWECMKHDTDLLTVAPRTVAPSAALSGRMFQIRIKAKKNLFL